MEYAHWFLNNIFTFKNKNMLPVSGGYMHMHNGGGIFSNYAYGMASEYMLQELFGFCYEYLI